MNDSGAEQMRPSSAPICALIFLSGLLFRVWLIYTYPALYGGDTVIHIRNHDHILLNHQLPALQTLLFLTYKITDAPIAFRLVTAVLGAAAGLGFYLLSSRIMTRVSACCSAAFFVTNPFLNEISIVPFQEILMLGALCFAAYFYIERRVAFASVALGIACLTRYEAWIACPILFLNELRYMRRTPFNALKALGLFCWAPALWIAFHSGLSTSGTYVIEAPQSAGRLIRWLYLAWITVKNTPLPVLALGGIGLFLIVRDRRYRSPGSRALIAFAGLFLVAVLCSAHGDAARGSGTAEWFVSSREATLVLAYVLLLAGVCIDAMIQNHRPLAIAIGTVSVALGLVQSARFVRSETSQPEVQLCYRLARYLDDHVGTTGRVLILAKPFRAEQLNVYLEKARQSGGESGWQSARANLRKQDLSPIDFQRTAVQCRLREDQLKSAGLTGDENWIALWSNVEADAGLMKRLRTLPVHGLLRQGSVTITIYHLGG